MNENESKLLKNLTDDYSSAQEIAKTSGIPLPTIMSISTELENQQLLQSKKSVFETIHLTAEGEDYAKRGLPEKRLAEAAVGKITLREAVENAKLGEAEGKIALQWAIRKKLINIEKIGSETFVKKNEESEEDKDEQILQAVASNAQEAPKEFEKELKNLEQRKLIEKKISKETMLRITEKGRSEIKSGKKELTTITPKILKSKEWKDADIKPYDLHTVIAPLTTGKRHFYKQFLEEIKESLVGLGFQEMNGELVENAFWDLDALLMPQDHPAREMHDLFFTGKKGEISQKDTMQKVADAHRKLWQYKWSEDKAREIILRSQTTALSARILSTLKPNEIPTRRFTIGKVFRPDEIDWKHFIEFNQCEGIVADGKMTLRELLGYLKVFAIEICGAEDVKFVPSYFPFTEPSVEFFVKINSKWVEIGGAGMFRQEMLQALGINVPVLAWGIGIDRLALIRLGITDLRDLHTQNLELIMQK